MVFIVHRCDSDFRPSCAVVFARSFRQARYVRESILEVELLVKVVLIAFPVLVMSDNERQQLCSEVSTVRQGVNLEGQSCI